MDLLFGTVAVEHIIIPHNATNQKTMPPASSSVGPPPWEVGESSSLDRSRGSAEDLLNTHLKAQKACGECTESSSTPGPNASFDAAIKINAEEHTSTKSKNPPTSSKTQSPAANAEIEKNRLNSRTTTNVKVATANIKYKNEAGRAAVLAVSTAVHHDFGALTSILNVTLPADAMGDLRGDPNIDWVDGSGAVYFVQPYRL